MNFEQPHKVGMMSTFITDGKLKERSIYMSYLKSYS